MQSRSEIFTKLKQHCSPCEMRKGVSYVCYSKYVLCASTEFLYDILLTRSNCSIVRYSDLKGFRVNGASLQITITYSWNTSPSFDRSKSDYFQLKFANILHRWLSRWFWYRIIIIVYKRRLCFCLTPLLRSNQLDLETF